MTDSTDDTEKMAELGRMTRGLIHDINNSLASIIGYAEFLTVDLEDGSEAHLFATNIKKAGNQLQGVLEEVRRFEKKVSGVSDIPLQEPHTTSEYTSCPPQSVLLIEDREMVRHTIETMLQRDGHRVTSFDDGLQGLDCLRENPDGFDIVMTDFTMPSINGRDMVDEIRHDFKKIPIILISGYDGFLMDAADATIVTLPKPITPSALRHALSAVIKN